MAITTNEILAIVSAGVAAGTAFVSMRTSRQKSDIEQRQELWKELESLRARLATVEAENEALRTRNHSLQEEQLALTLRFRQLEHDCRQGKTAKGGNDAAGPA